MVKSPTAMALGARFLALSSLMLVSSAWGQDVDNAPLYVDSGAYEETVEQFPAWTIRAGAVFLTRTRPDPRLTIRPTTGTTQIAGSEDFGFTTGVGPDVVLERNFGGALAIQARYFGAVNWFSDVAYGVPGNFQLGSFSNFGATDLTGFYRSRLNSAELNGLYQVSDRISLIGGFRWIELQDNLTYNVVFPAFSAGYHWNESNQLYGGQLGLNLALWNLDGPFTIDAAFKGGLYNNNSTNTFALLPSTGGIFPGGATQNAIAFAGDLNVTARYQITSHLALRGGYQLLWLDGLALATDQAALATLNSTQNAIRNQGHFLAHGALAGLEATW